MRTIYIYIYDISSLRVKQITPIFYLFYAFITQLYVQLLGDFFQALKLVPCIQVLPGLSMTPIILTRVRGDGGLWFFSVPIGK